MEKVKNYAPQRCYERPVAKMEGATTANMSYLPNKVAENLIALALVLIYISKMEGVSYHTNTI